jgi:hypothetical protein
LAYFNSYFRHLLFFFSRILVFFTTITMAYQWRQSTSIIQLHHYHRAVLQSIQERINDHLLTMEQLAAQEPLVAHYEDDWIEVIHNTEEPDNNTQAQEQVPGPFSSAVYPSNPIVSIPVPVVPVPVPRLLSEDIDEWLEERNAMIVGLRQRHGYGRVVPLYKERKLVIAKKKLEQPCPSQCSICYDMPKYKDALHTSCNHYYCNDCWTGWMRAANSNKQCPVCRAQTPTVTTFRARAPRRPRVQVQPDVPVLNIF